MTLRDRLPDIRGTYAEAAPMTRYNWFGVGGPADVIFCPRDADDLACFLASCPADIPLLPIGAGSNLLVRDGGVAGVVIRMNQFMTAIKHDGDEITADGFLSNHAGGVLGGISTGQDIVATLALKPTSSIRLPGRSLTTSGEETEVITTGRHDPCVGIRATPIAEAMLALTIMDHFLRDRGQIGRK